MDKFSDDVIVDGANVLIKSSRLVCGMFPDAKITFTDNLFIQPFLSEVELLK